MSEEEEHHTAVAAGCGVGGGGDHAAGGGGLPRLVVPGLTPRSSTSSQSCLSVPGTADVNGYQLLQHSVSLSVYGHNEDRQGYRRHQGPDLQNILRQSYDYLTIMPKL